MISSEIYPSILVLKIRGLSLASCLLIAMMVIYIAPSFILAHSGVGRSTCLRSALHLSIRVTL